MLRKLGTYVEYSVFGSDVTVDWSIISDDKELDVRGAHLGPHCWPAAIRMIESGRLPMDGICTHQLPLAQLPGGPGPGRRRGQVDQGVADPVSPRQRTGRSPFPSAQGARDVSSRRTFSRNRLIALGLIVVLVVVMILNTKFLTPEELAAAGPKKFDPAATADELFTKAKTELPDRAAELGEVLTAIQDDPKAAAEKYQATVPAEGNYIFAVKTTASVSAGRQDEPAARGGRSAQRTPRSWSRCPPRSTAPCCATRWASSSPTPPARPTTSTSATS